MKLVDRIPLPVPSDPSAAASVAAENAKIDAINLGNKREREAVEREYKVRLDAKITTSLLPRAKLRLEALHAAHALTDSSGTVIPDSFDGLAEWKELSTLKVEDGDAVAKNYQKRLEEIRDSQLPDNVSPNGSA